MQLISELRNATNVSISKAREALIASDSDIVNALAWIRNDTKLSGARKVAKLSHRSANEGLVGISVISPGFGMQNKIPHVSTPVQAAIVELNCETDFVARNEIFRTLVQNIAHSVAYLTETVGNAGVFSDLNPPEISNMPVISRSGANQSETIASAVESATAALGEKITLRRAVSIATIPRFSPIQHNMTVGSYLHGGVASDSSTGNFGCLVVVGFETPDWNALCRSDRFCVEFESLHNALARQLIGLNADCIRKEDEGSDPLYEQAFVMLPADESRDLTVRQYLDHWIERQGLNSASSRLEVLDLVRWKVGAS